MRSLLVTALQYFLGQNTGKQDSSVPSACFLSHSVVTLTIHANERFYKSVLSDAGVVTFINSASQSLPDASLHVIIIT